MTVFVERTCGVGLALSNVVKTNVFEPMTPPEMGTVQVRGVPVQFGEPGVKETDCAVPPFTAMLTELVLGETNAGWRVWLAVFVFAGM
jgi:hypothetical protein